MGELIFFAAVWIVVLAYIAAVSTETMQMTWLVGLALMVLLAPIIAIFWPMFR